MSPRTTLHLLLLAALAGAGAAQSQAEVLQYMNQMPECGLACVLQEVPKSACGTFSNLTCICTDHDFYLATQACVMLGCTSPLDAIDVARIEAKACQRPVRDRRNDLYPVLALMLLGVFGVALRLWARWSTLKTFMTDDWIMLVCGILSLPFIVIGQYGSHTAFGQDIWTVDPAVLTTGLKLFYVAQIFYLVTLGLTKLSLLCFLLRIFPNTSFRWITYGTMLVTAASTVIFVFMGIFQCIPVSYNWEGWKGTIETYRCLDVNALVTAAAGFSIALDVIILLIPLPLLFGLQMSWRSKAGILLMFSLGGFIVATACVRLRYTMMYRQSINPTWDHTDVTIWSGLEVAVSMIVTSLPAIRTMIRDRLPGYFTTVFSKKSSADPGSHLGNSKNGFNSIHSSKGDPGDHELNTLTQPQGVSSKKFGNRFSIYTIMEGQRNNNESEEKLELGDHISGRVYTNIAASNNDLERGRVAPFDNNIPDGDGIHVQTTTRIDSLRSFGGTRR